MPRPAKNSANQIRARLPPAGMHADNRLEPVTGVRVVLVTGAKAV
jgi:hypothetical protein